MRAFKNLDFFRKVAPEHTKPTVIGGLVSLLSLSVGLIRLTLGYRLSSYCSVTK
jgi:hypothetical protein